MKIIHQNGYTADELALYRHTVYKNLVDSAKSLVGAIKQFEVDTDDKHAKEMCDYVQDFSLDPDPESQISPEFGDALTAVWTDPALGKVMDHSTSFYLMDSAP